MYSSWCVKNKNLWARMLKSVSSSYLNLSFFCLAGIRWFSQRQSNLPFSFYLYRFIPILHIRCSIRWASRQVCLCMLALVDSKGVASSGGSQNFRLDGWKMRRLRLCWSSSYVGLLLKIPSPPVAFHSAPCIALSVSGVGSGVTLPIHLSLSTPIEPSNRV